MNLSPYIFPQFFDDNGDPLASGLIYAYEANTSTPKNTYTDISGATANANPIVLAASGRTKFFIDEGLHDFVLKNSAGTTLATIDDVEGSTGAGGASLQIVATVAAVRALPAGSSDYVKTAGYTTKGDGEHRWFYWSASSSATDNSQTVLTPNSAPATGRWLSVEEEAAGARTYTRWSENTTGFQLNSRKSRGTRTTPANVNSSDYVFELYAQARVSGSFVSVSDLKVLMDASTTAYWEMSRVNFTSAVLLGSGGRGTNTAAYSTASGSPTSVSALNKSRLIITPTAGAIQYISLSGGTDGQVLFVFNAGTGANEFYITNAGATTYSAAASPYVGISGGVVLCYDFTLGFWLPGGGET